MITCGVEMIILISNSISILASYIPNDIPILSFRWVSSSLKIMCNSNCCFTCLFYDTVHMLLEYRHFLGGPSETIHQPAKQALPKATTAQLAPRAHGSAGPSRTHRRPWTHEKWEEKWEPHGILMVFNVGKTIINHPLGRVYTTYKSGDLGDGLWLFYPHEWDLNAFMRFPNQPWGFFSPKKTSGNQLSAILDCQIFVRVQSMASPN